MLFMEKLENMVVEMIPCKFNFPHTEEKNKKYIFSTAVYLRNVCMCFSATHPLIRQLVSSTTDKQLVLFSTDLGKSHYLNRYWFVCPFTCLILYPSCVCMSDRIGIDTVFFLSPRLSQWACSWNRSEHSKALDWR